MAIAPRAVGAWAAVQAGTQTVTLPTHATGDMLIVRCAYKSPALTSCSVAINTAGWAQVAPVAANGTTNSGNGTGSVRIIAFWKVATSAAETNPVITWSTGVSPGCAVAVSYQPDSGYSWADPTGAGGGDTTAGTTHIATIASHIPVRTGDMVDVFSAICDDTTMTVPTFTQTGVTFAAVTEYPATALLSTTGDDISADGCYRLATAGTSSAAAVVTSTTSTSETGSSWMTRLRYGGSGTLTVNAIIKRTKSTADGTTGGVAPTGDWTSGAATGSAEFFAHDIAYGGDGYWVMPGANNSTAAWAYATDPTGSWTMTSTTGSLDGVAYGNGYWVMVGTSGNVQIRPTLASGSWAANTQGGGSPTFMGVAYGNGYWVAVGTGGTLYYKATDPTGAWTSNPQGSITLQRVTYANGYWVAVGNGALWYKASDPTGAWTANHQGGTTDFTDVAYGNGYWVAGGNPETILVKAGSDPSGTWTAENTPSRPVTSIVYGNGYFVAGLSGGIADATLTTASDPTGTWTEAVQTAAGTDRIQAVGIDSAGTTWVWASADVDRHIYYKTGAGPTGIAPFTLDAVFAAPSTTTITGSFTANAVLKKTISVATLTAHAVTKRTQTGSASLNAVIKPVRGWVVRDTFTRSVSDGWGTPDEGPTWANDSADLTIVDVDGSAGTITLPGLVAASMTIGDLKWQDQSIVFTTSFSSVGSGHEQIMAAMRQVNPDDRNYGHYRGRLDNYGGTTLHVAIARVLDYASTELAVAVVAISSYVLGERIKVRFSAIGTNPTALSLTAWREAENEPAPQRTATDSEARLQHSLYGGLQSFSQASTTPVITVDDLYAWASGPSTFTASAWIAGRFSADAVIKRTQTGSLTANAVLAKTATGSLTADAILAKTIAGSLTANAALKGTQASSTTLAATLGKTQAGTTTLEALLLRVGAAALSADAVISLVGTCVWTTPADGVQMDATPTLAFLMPTAAGGDMHFTIQVDTDPGYSAPLTYISHRDLAGWEYWDGGGWQPIPQSGVPVAFVGNEARYTLQSSLAEGTYYRRVRAGVI